MSYPANPPGPSGVPDPLSPPAPGSVPAGVPGVVPPGAPGPYPPGAPGSVPSGGGSGAGGGSRGAGGSGGRGRGGAADHRRSKRRWWPWVLIIIGLALAAAGAWLAYTGLAAKRALESAASALGGAQSAILEGDVAAAEQSVTQASALTAEARAKTSDPVWKIAGALPLIGATPRAVTLASDAADQVISGALPQFVAAARTLDITTIKGADGRVDLARFAPAGQQLASAQTTLREAKETMAEVPTSGVPGFVSAGTAELSEKVDEALAISTTASSLLGVLPQMLGAGTPQKYFVAYQSPVEIRGTGGFLGTYGLLDVADGQLVGKETYVNSTLVDFPEPVVDLGPDYTSLYGANNIREWTGMNLSPNFPYAGVQWATAWQKQSGQQVAGVLGVDISALKYLIQATGPVTAPDGRQLTADNVIQYLGNDIYLQFAADNTDRKEYQAAIANELIDRVLRLEGGTTALVKALTDSVSGGHIQLWSADPGIQQVLATTPLAGQTSEAPGPYFQLVLNNGGGNKLDYYLKREVTYTGGKCFDGYRESTARVALTNTVDPAGLPGNNFGRIDPGAPGAAPGSNRLQLMVFLPVGGGINKARINGQDAQLTFGAERGRSVAYVFLDVAPGAPVTLDFDLLEPLSDAAPRVPEQPMVIPQATTIDWRGC